MSEIVFGLRTKIEAFASIVMVTIIGILLVINGGLRHSLDTEKAGRQADKEAIKKAQDKAAADFQADLDSKEAHYQMLAQQKDLDHDKDVAAVQSAADDRIRALRLQFQTNSRSAGKTAASAPGSAAGVPAEVPADPAMASIEADLRQCAEINAYAVGAYNWALTLDQPQGK